MVLLLCRDWHRVMVVKLCWHSPQSQSVWQTKYKICITKITEWQGRPLRLPWGQLLTREQWRTCLYADQCGLCLSTCSPELRVSPVIFSPHSSRLFISGHHNNQQGQLASQSQAFSAPSSTFRTLILAENRPGKHRHDRNEMLWHFESDLGSSNNQEDPLATSNWDLVLGGLKLMMVNQYWSYRWQVSILALLGGTGRNATDSLTKSKEGWKTNHWSDSSLIIKISLDWGECFVLDDLLVESTVTVIWLSISKLSCG